MEIASQDNRERLETSVSFLSLFFSISRKYFCCALVEGKSVEKGNPILLLFAFFVVGDFSFNLSSY